MLLAAGRALGRLLAAGPPLRSVVPAASLTPPPSAGSPFPGRGDTCPPSCRSLKPSDCFWLCCGAPLGPWLVRDCPTAPQGPQPLGTLPAPGEPAAKLSLSRGLAEGQELQGFGEAPAKQRWWGGGLLGAPHPSSPNRGAPGAGRVPVPPRRCGARRGLHRLCPGRVGMGLCIARGVCRRSEAASQIFMGWHRGCKELGSGVGHAVLSSPLCRGWGGGGGCDWGCPCPGCKKLGDLRATPSPSVHPTGTIPVQAEPPLPLRAGRSAQGWAWPVLR